MNSLTILALSTLTKELFKLIKLGYISEGDDIILVIALTSLVLIKFLLRHKSNSDFIYTLLLILVITLFKLIKDDSSKLLLAKFVLRHKSKLCVEYKSLLKSVTLLFTLLKDASAATIVIRSPDTN